VRRAVSISGLYDLAPIARAPSLQGDLRLTPAVVARASPARFEAPAGAQLCAVVGALESEEFLRHNRMIRRRWGSAVVPVCEELPGRDHFTVLDALVEPQASLHRRVADWLAD
jgi:arylformamidase